MIDFGSRLRDIRTDAGYTQSALARRMETSQSAISQMEGGDRQPSLRMLQRLAGVLGVTVGYLLGEGSPRPEKAEEQLFHQYRSLPEEARAQVRIYTEFLCERNTGDQWRD